MFPAGRDFSHDETLDVPTQVELLIKQATSHENLCQCYIGWSVQWSNRALDIHLQIDASQIFSRTSYYMLNFNVWFYFQVSILVRATKVPLDMSFSLVNQGAALD